MIFTEYRDDLRSVDNQINEFWAMRCVFGDCSNIFGSAGLRCEGVFAGPSACRETLLCGFPEANTDWKNIKKRLRVLRSLLREDDRESRARVWLYKGTVDFSSLLSLLHTICWSSGEADRAGLKRNTWADPQSEHETLSWAETEHWTDTASVHYDPLCSAADTHYTGEIQTSWAESEHQHSIYWLFLTSRMEDS